MADRLGLIRGVCRSSNLDLAFKVSLDNYRFMAAVLSLELLTRTDCAIREKLSSLSEQPHTLRRRYQRHGVR